MRKSTGSHKRQSSRPPKTGPAEEKLGNVGTLAGKVVDKMARAPGDIGQSASTRAADARKRASRAASKVAQDVATRLDPDSAKNR